jgi:hypothetical protein
LRDGNMFGPAVMDHAGAGSGSGPGLSRH